MKEAKNRREESGISIELDQIEHLHRDALNSQGCSDSELEQVAGGGDEVSAI